MDKPVRARNPGGDKSPVHSGLFGERHYSDDDEHPVVNFSWCPHLNLFDAITFTEMVVKMTIESPSMLKWTLLLL